MSLPSQRVARRLRRHRVTARACAYFVRRRCSSSATSVAPGSMASRRSSSWTARSGWPGLRVDLRQVLGGRAVALVQLQGAAQLRDRGAPGARVGGRLAEQRPAERGAEVGLVGDQARRLAQRLDRLVVTAAPSGARGRPRRARAPPRSDGERGGRRALLGREAASAIARRGRHAPPAPRRRASSPRARQLRDVRLALRRIAQRAVRLGRACRRSPAPSCDRPRAPAGSDRRGSCAPAPRRRGRCRRRARPARRPAPRSNPACGRSAASSTAGRSRAARWSGGGAAGAPSTGIDDTGGATRRRPSSRGGLVALDHPRLRQRHQQQARLVARDLARARGSPPAVACRRCSG